MEIEIRNATLFDIEYLFKLANDPIARSNSFNPKPIIWDEHVKWFSNRLEYPDSFTFIFLTSDTPIGIVKFDIKEKTVIGVTVDPNFRGLGIGSQIIKLGCNEFWKTKDDDIWAYVKNTNIGSIKSFEKASFKCCLNTKINGTECSILKASKNEY